MFDKNHEIALGVLNSVIWKLYERGYHLAADLIETERDREAVKVMNLKDKAQQNREIRYARVAEVYKESHKSYIRMIAQIKEMGMLEKVYFCSLTNAVEFRSYEKVIDLYNSSAHSYLITFEGWFEGKPMYKDDLDRFRATLDTVGRCIRHIKADKPDLFNADLIRTSDEQDAVATETHGNSVV